MLDLELLRGGISWPHLKESQPGSSESVPPHQDRVPRKPVAGCSEVRTKDTTQIPSSASRAKISSASRKVTFLSLSVMSGSSVLTSLLPPIPPGPPGRPEGGGDGAGGKAVSLARARKSM